MPPAKDVSDRSVPSLRFDVITAPIPSGISQPPVLQLVGIIPVRCCHALFDILLCISCDPIRSVTSR